MFTVTFVIQEKPGTDRATALKHWGTTHADLVRQVPGVQRYVQQHAVAGPDGDPPFLGVASLYFADQAAFETAAASPEFGAAVADVANFGSPELATAFTEDHVIVG
ncbi:MAG: ethD like-protein [Klenkia sp.]|nr:ethD like-protein [Klenkia sp.]